MRDTPGRDWAERAACANRDPDELFVRGSAQGRAKRICAPCPVRDYCLAEALDNQIDRGVWGGMTERERRALLRLRPEVTSWRRLLVPAPAGAGSAQVDAGTLLNTVCSVSAPSRLEFPWT